MFELNPPLDCVRPALLWIPVIHFLSSYDVELLVVHGTVLFLLFRFGLVMIGMGVGGCGLVYWFGFFFFGIGNSCSGLVWWWLVWVWVERWTGVLVWFFF